MIWTKKRANSVGKRDNNSKTEKERGYNKEDHTSKKEREQVRDKIVVERERNSKRDSE